MNRYDVYFLLGLAVLVSVYLVLSGIFAAYRVGPYEPTPHPVPGPGGPARRGSARAAPARLQGPAAAEGAEGEVCGDSAAAPA